MAKPLLLLITPENPRIRRHRRWQFNNFTQITMPYLAGFVDPERFRIRLVDEYNESVPYPSGADLVAITVSTPNAPHCYHMADRFRARGAQVVLGGPHITLCPEEAAPHGQHLVVGEAEETWPRFLEDFLAGAARSRYLCPRPPALAGLPIPRRDLIRRRPFTKGAVFASRGCPHQCDFCSLKRIYAPGVRTRPVEEVVADVMSIPDRHFVFWDDNFFADPGYAARLMAALKGLGRRWAAQATLDRCRDESLLRLAREAGCIYLFLGLETFSEPGLAAVGKACNQVHAYRPVIEAIHRQGIRVQAGIIFGLDTDGPEVFARTLEACADLGIDGVTPSILTPLPGTRVHEELAGAGRLRNLDWSWYDGKTRVAFTPKRMSPEALQAGFLWFRRRFYSLPAIFRRLAAAESHRAALLLVNLGYRLSL